MLGHAREAKREGERKICNEGEENRRRKGEGERWIQLGREGGKNKGIEKGNYRWVGVVCVRL